MKKVSIIVPVYNAGLFLEKCIKSILNQTYNNIELILINDGSTDNSEEICQDFLRLDNRIKYLYQVNAGVSSARNTGINAASGDYVCFVDSDDRLPENAIQLFLHSLEDSDSDLVISGYINDFGEKKQPVQIEEIEIEGNMNIILYFERHFQEGISSSVWGKLYKISLIKELFDVKMSMGEDLSFNLDYISNIQKLSVINKPLYIYNQVNEGSLTKFIQFPKYQNIIKVCKKMISVVNERKLSTDEYNNAYKKLTDHFYSFVCGIVKKESDSKNILRYLNELHGDPFVVSAIKNTKKCFHFHHKILYNLFLHKKFSLLTKYVRILLMISERK